MRCASMRDAIVIGGGIAGMSAAWRLRHSDVLVLEGSNRIGGRLRSERRGAYWLNWGGHVFGGVQMMTVSSAYLTRIP